MRGLVLLICASLALPGCSGIFGGGSGASKKVTFDGQRFRGSAKAVDRADRSVFIATAGPVSRSPEGAREAVRYEGTRYCIRWFGISDIDWEIDPDAETLPVQNDKAVLKGKCVE